MKLADLQQLKLFLDKTDNDHDVLLDYLLTWVSKRIETFLNRNLFKQARTETFDAGRRYYFLSAYPIDSSAALTVVYAGVTQTINSDYYVWYDDGIVEFYAPTTYGEPKQIVITYTGGYATTSALPYDIHYATIQQVAFIFRRRKDVGVQSISLPDGSMSVNAPLELLPEVVRSLQPYRKRPMVF